MAEQLVVKDRPAAPCIIARYLKESIIPADTTFEIEIAGCLSRSSDSFNTYGSARLEVLFYEKASSEPKREQIIMYGIAENIYSQLRSFAIFCNTSWFESPGQHPEHNYFDSIILDLSATSPVINGSTLAVNLRKPGGKVSAHSSIILRFDLNPADRNSDSLRGSSFLPELSVQTT